MVCRSRRGSIHVSYSFVRLPRMLGEGMLTVFTRAYRHHLWSCRKALANYGLIVALGLGAINSVLVIILAETQPGGRE